MAVLVTATAVAVVLFLLLLVFPPRRARRWRHYTRPVRRRLRPGHYRAW